MFSQSPALSLSLSLSMSLLALFCFAFWTLPHSGGVFSRDSVVGFGHFQHFRNEHFCEMNISAWPWAILSSAFVSGVAFWDAITTINSYFVY